TIELVEKDRLKIGTVLQNAAMAERALGKRIACHFVAAELFLKRCKNQYDLIFCDPPFPYKFHQQIAETLSAKNLLKPGGLFLMHYPRELNLPEHTGSLARCDRREYGRSIVDFFQKETI
ncbi:MAG: RsmD family RNA methyltransferase, partial [Treponema sp.]|nr:RsmD family RNA methyltransferase [Treponema sp.]